MSCSIHAPCRKSSTQVGSWYGLSDQLTPPSRRGSTVTAGNGLMSSWPAMIWPAVAALNAGRPWQALSAGEGTAAGRAAAVTETARDGAAVTAAVTAPRAGAAAAVTDARQMPMAITSAWRRASISAILKDGRSNSGNRRPDFTGGHVFHRAIPP